MIEAYRYNQTEAVESRSPLEEIRNFGRTGVFVAHPDDDVFLLGGTLAIAAETNDVVIVTATKGERGGEIHNWSWEQTAQAREAEQKAALKTIGIPSYNQHWLGYTDGELARSDHEEAIKKMVEYMQEFDLQTIITFGSEGVTGHDDHRKMSELATQAFQRFGKQDTTLYHMATPREWTYGTSKKVLDEIVFYYPGFPAVQVWHDSELNISLPSAVLRKKREAIIKHDSQYAHLLPQLPSDQLDAILSKERLIKIPIKPETRTDTETVLYIRR